MKKGSYQGNKAHFAELVAVSAIRHFVGTPDQDLSQWYMFYTKWLQTEKGDLDRSKWGPELDDEILCLARFYAFGKFFTMMKEDSFYPVNKLFYKAIAKSNQLEKRLEDIQNFIFSEDGDTDSFMRWIAEMRENKRKFTAVNTNDVKYTESDNTYAFTPKTPNAVYNGANNDNDVNMSNCFMAVNKAYRKSLKKQTQMDEVLRLLQICHEGIASVIKVD